MIRRFQSLGDGRPSLDSVSSAVLTMRIKCFVVNITLATAVLRSESREGDQLRGLIFEALAMDLYIYRSTLWLWLCRERLSN